MKKIYVPTECMDRMYSIKPLVVITTVDKDGFINAAPFGMCMRVSHDPLTLAFSTRDKWHTCKNAKETGEFVVNVPSESEEMFVKMLIMGERFPRRVNEIEKAQLTSLPSKTVKPPRIKECKVHFECKVDWTRDVERNYVLVAGKVLATSVDEDVITKDYSLRLDKLRPFHYLGWFYQTCFVGIGEIHDVSHLFTRGRLHRYSISQKQ